MGELTLGRLRCLGNERSTKPEKCYAEPVQSHNIAILVDERGHAVSDILESLEVPCIRCPNHIAEQNEEGA